MADVPLIAPLLDQIAPLLGQSGGYVGRPFSRSTAADGLPAKGVSAMCRADHHTRCNGIWCSCAHHLIGKKPQPPLPRQSAWDEAISPSAWRPPVAPPCCAAHVPGEAFYDMCCDGCR